MREIWKDILWYEGLYQVSNLWNVRSLSYNRCWYIKNLSPAKNDKWYLYVGLSINGTLHSYAVHRLVARTFLEYNFEKKEINHRNWIKVDNRLKNLEYVNHFENMQHASNIGFIKQKPVSQFTLSWELIKHWNSASWAARILGLSQSGIRCCCVKKHNRSQGFMWRFRENTPKNS